MRALVTGADGFIGSHLVEHLVYKGYTVRAFCCYNSFSSWGWLDTIDKSVLEQVDVVLGDIRDQRSVTDAAYGVDIVFHLAALIAIPYSYTAPSSYIDTNIKGTLNILEAVRTHKVPRVVCTSTSETYGTAQFVPITESHPLVAQSPYAATKIASDQLAISYWHSFSTPVTILRPFNTYGPRQSCRAVIPTIITQLLSGVHKLKLGSISPTRDFNYVKDTCAAFLAAATCDDCLGKVLNASSDYEISIGDTARLISEVMGKNIEIITDEQRLRPIGSEVNRLYGDSSLLRKLTGWHPEFAGVSGLRRGISSTVDWFSNPKNLSLYKSQIYNT